VGQPRQPPFQPALQPVDRAAPDLDRHLASASCSACRWSLLGFHPAMIAICGGFNLIYQFWIHTEAIDKRMPRWFEAVMNTPSHHRVHHATNPRYLDRNYAGVFIVWDRMFGTFEPELR
jgi:sterol desaturase/sphingolipid hydroxylase (fatty acid hydroxylase superfamily)